MAASIPYPSNSFQLAKSCNTTDKAMRVGLRPYIQIGNNPDGANKPIADWITGEKGDRVGVTVHFWNAGSTPGIRLYVNGATVPGSMGPSHHLEPQPVANGSGISWTNGTLISARGPASVQIAGVGALQIKNEFATVAKTKQIFEVEGSFEYMNVFDEWCCESYCLTLDSTKRFTSCMGELRSLVCSRPDNVVNVCERKGELKIPYYR